MATGCKHCHEEKIVGANGLLRLTELGKTFTGMETRGLASLFFFFYTQITYLLKIVNEKSYCAWRAQL